MQDNAMARGQEMAGHWPSHGAKSDETDVDHGLISLHCIGEILSAGSVHLSRLPERSARSAG
jgi:hypothetical protein